MTRSATGSNFSLTKPANLASAKRLIRRYSGALTVKNTRPAGLELLKGRKEIHGFAGYCHFCWPGLLYSGSC
jgi:hypothetical protein